jgi:hypothetical protein
MQLLAPWRPSVQLGLPVQSAARHGEASRIDQTANSRYSVVLANSRCRVALANSRYRVALLTVGIASIRQECYIPKAGSTVCM